jgi:hypothetical protein
MRVFLKLRRDGKFREEVRIVAKVPMELARKYLAEEL